jgi:hypothetical protein
MDDFNGLAQRVALSADDVHGCLILSRDGLVLGSYPTIDDSVAKSSWLKFAKSLGEPERGFVEFADQVWVFARKGPYSAFAVGGPAIRPGVLLETVEQALMSAEQGRANRDALRIPDAPAAPSGKPRTSLHPQAPSRAPEPTSVLAEAEAVSAEVQARSAEVEPASAEAASAEAPTTTTDQEAEAAAETLDGPDPDIENHPSRRSEPRLAGQKEPSDDDVEVDRVMLAQEFSGLLQMGETDDEGSS